MSVSANRNLRPSAIQEVNIDQHHRLTTLSAYLLIMPKSKTTWLLPAAVLAAARLSGAFTIPMKMSKTRRNHVYTISQEISEADLSNNEEDEPWALRQITFLDLTASGPEDDAELDARNFSEFLMEIGACSVSITDADANTSAEEALFHEPSLTTCPNDYVEDNSNDFAMILNDYAAGRNVWKRCHVSAHFPSSLFDVPTLVDAVRHTFQIPTTPRFEVDTVPDLDWIKHVQESWTPIVTDSKFVLRFPWHDDSLVMKACQEVEREKMTKHMAKRFSSGVKREGAVVHFEDDDEESNGTESLQREYVQIRLEGGIAFGTGEHPTTKLCLGWIRDKVEMHFRMINEKEKSLNIVDYGSGSGVLGIAAASVIRYHTDKLKRKQGSIDISASVVGLEIDADAIHIANDNSQKNNVEMKNYLPDVESLDDEALSVVLRAMQRKRNKDTIQFIPSELNGPIYDLCVANILAGPLVKLAPTISNLVKNGGLIGLSGILSSQADMVVEAYEEYFEDVEVAAEDGGWVLVTGKRR